VCGAHDLALRVHERGTVKMSLLDFRCEPSATDVGINPASAGRGRARMPIRPLRPAPHSHPAPAGHSLRHSS
jgi:hypothetical protein